MLKRSCVFHLYEFNDYVTFFWKREYKCKKRENESGIQDESQKCENFTDFLFNIRKHHSNKVIMTHININSLGNKFDMLTNSVSEYIDILMISETKLDDTFPHALYHLKDFSNPYRLDRNSHGGGILVYVRDNILKV